MGSISKSYKVIGKTNTSYFEDKTAKKNGALETYTIAGLNNSIIGIASDAVMGKTSISSKPPAPEKVVASDGTIQGQNRC